MKLVPIIDSNNALIGSFDPLDHENQRLMIAYNTKITEKLSPEELAGHDPILCFKEIYKRKDGAYIHCFWQETPIPQSPFEFRYVANFITARKACEYMIHWGITPDAELLKESFPEDETSRITQKPDKSQDTIRKSEPRSPVLNELISRLRRGIPQGKKQIDIALDVVNGTKKEAENTLRQARRYKSEWHPEYMQ